MQGTLKFQANQHVPLKLQANNGEIFILLHVTKCLFILQSPNFSLGDLRKSLPEDKKKNKCSKEAQHRVCNCYSHKSRSGKMGCTAVHTSSPSKASLLNRFPSRCSIENGANHFHCTLQLLGDSRKEALGTFFMICC